MTCTQHFNAGSRHQCEKGFIRTDELEIVKAGINRGGINTWHAVEEKKKRKVPALVFTWSGVNSSSGIGVVYPSGT